MPASCPGAIGNTRPRWASGAGALGKGIPAPSRCAALTGSRDSTSYHAAVTGDIAYGLDKRADAQGLSRLGPTNLGMPTGCYGAGR
ncbi:hypothetical protein [Arthrobacter sp. QXT-31]|uniref:hypothetical protein n=1 Tax=Arthrobacter sp. QXT-31 TaxID=1357915 RepID=UPI0012FBFFA9|nr:hypothetical protein [Arthrobacter sp. QXT-31]